MTANANSIDLAEVLSEHLERADPDLLRSLFRTFVEALMGAEADAICGAPYRTRSAERVNSRNGYRGPDVCIAVSRLGTSQSLRGRENRRKSSTRISGSSMAGKWPPRGMLVN
jgi:transposase-like protein